MANKHIFLIFPYSAMLFLAVAQFAHAQTAPQGLFFTGGVQQYLFPPEPFENPFLGGRLGVGWDLPLSTHGSFTLGLEAGWTVSDLKGPSRPADSASLVPLAFKAGYGFFFNRMFSLRLNALAGGMFLLDNAEDPTIFFFGGLLAAEWTFIHHTDGRPFLSLYSGGGADFITQTDALILLPQVELALRFRPGIPAPKVKVQPRDQAEAERLAKAERQAEAAPPAETENQTAAEDKAPSTAQRENHQAVELEDGAKGFLLDEFTVYFEGDSPVLNREGQSRLQQAADLLINKYPSTRILVLGHTSDIGRTASGEEEVSRRRAQAVADYLISLRVPPTQITTRWFGGTSPVASNSSASGRAANRRVELIVIED
jgi:outer membrane protein OmpA-like peptidoglycan-associated protein